MIGDTGYDSNDFRAEIRARGIKAVIHSKPERKRALPLDRKLYRRRYLVEVFLHSLKRFRAIATRFEKTRRNDLALVHVACIGLWFNEGQPLDPNPDSDRESGRARRAR